MTWVYQKGPVCQTLSKFLDISSTTARVAPHIVKALTILLHTTVRGHAVEWVDLKLYWRSEKRQISQGDQQAYYLQVFQRIH